MNDGSSTQFNSTRSAWKNEVYDLVRGASGGFLFGIPLISAVCPLPYESSVTLDSW